MNFENILEQSSLSVSAITGSPSSLDSFKASFSSELGIPEDDLMAAVGTFLRNEVAQTYLNVEYGPHSRIFGPAESILADGSCPPLLMLSAVAHTQQRKVIVVADEFNLAFLTKGQPLCLIEPVDIRFDPIVVALTGMGLFRTLIGDGRNRLTEIASLVPINSVLYLPEIVNIVEIDDDGTDIDESYDSDASVPEEVRNVLNTPVVAQPNNSVSIDQFLDSNWRIQNNVMMVQNQSYTSTTRIDFVASDYRNLSEANRNDVKFISTIDIDGFFVMTTHEELSEIFLTGGNILNPTSCAKSTIKAIQKHIADQGESTVKSIKVVRFGELNPSERFEIFAVLTAESNMLDISTDINLSEMIVCCHNAAMRFPCMDVEPACPLAGQHRGVISGRPNNTRQISTTSFKWRYGSPGDFKCLLKQFSQCLALQVRSFPGVKLRFFIRNIGCKDSFVSSSIADFPRLLKDVSAVFKVQTLMKENGPACSFDVSWKFIPTTSGNSPNKVH